MQCVRESLKLRQISLTWCLIEYQTLRNQATWQLEVLTPPPAYVVTLACHLQAPQLLQLRLPTAERSSEGRLGPDRLERGRLSCLEGGSTLHG